MEIPGPAHSRRHFLGAAAAAAMAAQFDMSGGAPATRTSFGPVKQINAGQLNVGYVEAGPANGQAVFPAPHPGTPNSRHSPSTSSRPSGPSAAEHWSL
jgi:hypothetical protein